MGVKKKILFSSTNFKHTVVLHMKKKKTTKNTKKKFKNMIYFKCKFQTYSSITNFFLKKYKFHFCPRVLKRVQQK